MNGAGLLLHPIYGTSGRNRTFYVPGDHRSVYARQYIAGSIQLAGASAGYALCDHLPVNSVPVTTPSAVSAR